MSTEELQNCRINTRISSLFFDGASKGKPRIVGAGGVIFDCKRNKQKEYACGIGRETNNGVEWYALIKGLELAKEMEIEEINVIGDSSIVIGEVRNISRDWNTPSAKMHHMFFCLVKEFNTITFLHVLRGQNQQALSMANKGVGLNCDVLENDSVITKIVRIP